MNPQYEAFMDEMKKIAGFREKVIQFGTRSPKATLAALLAAGGGLYHVGRGALEDWRLGRAVRKSQSQQ